MNVFEELKRRNVFRVGVAYAIGAWLTVQIADIVLDNISAPDWVMQTFFLLLAIGFVLALILAWAYEVTPEGIKRERDIVRDESITHLTAKKLDYITLAATLGVAILFGWQRYMTEPVTTVAAGGETASIAARLGEHSIAVLPFANRSNNDDDLFFTDGIHDDLLTQLAKIKGIKVISRTSVMEYRDTTKKIPVIAGELGVAKVIEGGVQRAGHRIRINAQLIDVATDEHLWAETFDEEMTIDNVFDIQSKIARQIVSAVKGQMTASDQETLAAAPTTSIAAYEAYSRARQVLSSSGYNMEKYQQAEPLAQQAVALDPDFAQAQLLLAEIHSYAYWIGWGVESRQEDARVAIDRAAEILGPEAPEVLAAEGNYLYRFERDFAGALAQQAKAAASIPGDKELWSAIGASQRRLGRWDEAVASFLRAYELDPAVPEAAAMASDTMLFLPPDDGRLQDFLTTARERFPYDTDLAAVHAMLPAMAAGDTQTARERLDAVRPNSGLQFVLASTELPWYERDFKAAIEAWEQPEVSALVSLEQTGWRRFSELYRGMAWRELSDNERADALLTAAAEHEIDPTMRPFARARSLGARAWARVLIGETERAIADAEEAANLVSYEADKLEGVVPVADLIFVLAYSGRRDEALALLPRVLDQPNGLRRWALYLDPRWDFMRDDERFNEMIRPHNLEQSIHATGSGT